jgi:hypothetical protein
MTNTASTMVTAMSLADVVPSSSCEPGTGNPCALPSPTPINAPAPAPVPAVLG